MAPTWSTRSEGIRTSFTALAAPPPFAYTSRVDDLSDKTALRAHLRRLRRNLTTAQPGAAQAAAGHLAAARLPAIATFSLYYPMGSEMDPRPLLAVLAPAAPCLPVAGHRDQPLIFRRWNANETLIPDAFGIASPPAGAPTLLPDLVIAPVLGFDSRGNRLGQGAGHYDRTLEALRRVKPVFVIGLAYAGQEVVALPAEPHDQKLDAILTETGYRTFV
jgi:5-formyltetrahydrofolate cyclo-ligase